MALCIIKLDKIAKVLTIIISKETLTSHCIAPKVFIEQNKNNIIDIKNNNIIEIKLKPIQ